jgi:hypothetical protein
VVTVIAAAQHVEPQIYLAVRTQNHTAN